MRRNDLRVWDGQTVTADHHPFTQPVTDAELAGMGLVALDGIDVEALREEFEIYGMGTQTDALIVKVLAALDLEAG